MTNKQRAYLKGLANKLSPAFQIGKSGVTPEMVDAVSEYLEANEIVKLSVLNNCEESVKDAADMVAGRSRAELVQVIGKKIILYRESKTKKTIELPK